MLRRLDLDLDLNITHTDDSMKSSPHALVHKEIIVRLEVHPLLLISDKVAAPGIQLFVVFLVKHLLLL